jgi:hypothetical protein
MCSPRVYRFRISPFFTAGPNSWVSISSIQGFQAPWPG